MMDSEIELKKAKNEVQRKIGRNLILFQHVEHMLKWLVANGKIQGYASEIRSIREQQIKDVSKFTLGSLVGRYIDNHQSLSEFENEEGPTQLKEPFITISTCTADAEYVQAKKDTLASLVTERNDLIHHLVSRIIPESIESWQETEKNLDRQFERFLPEHDQLQSMIKGIHEGRKELAELLMSDEGARLWKLGLMQQENIVLLLCHIATQDARHDGWTMLSTAGQRIQKEVPGQLATLKERYECKNLRELIVATELFEIIEEITEKGGLRTLYRLKPEVTKLEVGSIQH